MRDNGGHAVGLKWSMEAVYGVRPGEVYWAASDIGWVVGHSYIVYAPLLHGCTTILYEGKPVGTPDAGAFWRVCADHGVNAMFTAPTAIRAIKREDPAAELVQGYDLSALRTLFLAGERCDPDTLQWASLHLDRPVIDHWWQTESGWPMAANCVGLELLPVKPGSPTKPVPGYEICVLDEKGGELPAGETGAVCVRLPLPPGFAPTLWRGEQRFVDAYLARYEGFYLTGDAGYFDDDGYLYVMSRIDDVINTAGHRLSTGQMEEGRSQATRTSPNARSSEWRMSSRGRSRSASRCSRQASSARRRMLPLSWSRSYASAWARWRHSRPWRSWTHCQRRAQAKRCAPPSATWPTARLGAFPRRSRMRLSSMTSRNCCRRSALAAPRPCSRE